VLQNFPDPDAISFSAKEEIVGHETAPNTGADTTTRILGISGSLRSRSYNTALLKAAVPVLDAGVELEIASLHGIPLYHGDLEAAEGLPQAVRDLKTRVMAGDGLLLATPEYNTAIPGVFKNAIDWLSRPAADIPKVFGNRPVALIGASPGGFSTVQAQAQWLPVLRTLGTRPWFGARLLVSRAAHVFTDTGEMTDQGMRAQLRDFLPGFARFIQTNAAPQ
jgi:chromate reductase, NAD(P)H dehydrogenase (quinone)